MSARRLIFVGLALAACRDHDPPAAPRASGANGAPGAPAPGAGAPRAALAAPASPALEVGPAPAPPDDDPAPAVTSLEPTRAAPSAGALGAEAFANEHRDPAWAGEVEAEIRTRFRNVRGARLDGAECRHTQCQLTVVGTEGDVGRTIADLEGANGLHGFARQLILTAPERRADGTLVLRAFAAFER